MRLNHKVIRRTKGYGRHSRESRYNLPKQKIDLSFLKKGLPIYSNSLKERLHNKWKLGKQKIAGPFIIMDRKDLSFRPARSTFCKKERQLIKPEWRKIYGHRKKVELKSTLGHSIQMGWAFMVVEKYTPPFNLAGIC